MAPRPVRLGGCYDAFCGPITAAHVPVPYRIDSIRQAALSKAFGEFNGILSSALTLRCTGNGPPSLKSSYPGRHPRQIQIVVMCLSSVARRPICIHARVLSTLPS